jgi:predicted N-acyltransferase
MLRAPECDLSYAQAAALLIQHAQKIQVSSAHMTFCTAAETDALTGAGWMSRLGIQFHWHNAGYKHFDDFLAALSSNHRKNIRRERRDVTASGLTIKTLCGDEIKKIHWQAFYQFYLATTDKKWGQAYLTENFFENLSSRLGPRVVLIMAFDGDMPIAGALHLQGKNTLYGRNWGCVRENPFLHFEMCYYRAMDFAIERGLQKIEAGAQGVHKIQRGYLPEFTHSVHWIAHDGFAGAIEHFLGQERQAMRDEKDFLLTRSPFKNIGNH